QFVPAAKTRVEQVLFGQARKRGFVQSRPLALVIGSVGAAGRAALVSRKPEPGKVGFKQVGKLPRAALRVKVFDPQHHPAALPLGPKPGPAGGSRVSPGAPGAPGPGRGAPLPARRLSVELPFARHRRWTV